MYTRIGLDFRLGVVVVSIRLLILLDLLIVWIRSAANKSVGSVYHGHTANFIIALIPPSLGWVKDDSDEALSRYYYVFFYKPNYNWISAAAKRDKSGTATELERDGIIYQQSQNASSLN